MLPHGWGRRTGRDRNLPLERQLRGGKAGLNPEPPQSRTGAFLRQRVRMETLHRKRDRLRLRALLPAEDQK